MGSARSRTLLVTDCFYERFRACRSARAIRTPLRGAGPLLDVHHVELYQAADLVRHAVELGADPRRRGCRLVLGRYVDADDAQTAGNRRPALRLDATVMQGRTE